MRKIVLPLVVIAGFMNGLLAGGNVDRLLVATPAWRKVGLSAWADFSRAADLGRGEIVYPVLAIGSTALAVLAAVILLRNRRYESAAPVVSAGLSAVLMVGALPFSVKAVPFMQGLRNIRDGNVAALNNAFVGAHFWGGFQSYFHLAAFCCQLWAISVLARPAAPPRDAQPQVRDL